MLYIAIDGPAGAGKSTVARELAKQLKINYLDSGAMYRAFTLKVLQTGVDPEDGNSIRSLLENTVIDIRPEEDRSRIFLDGVEVTGEIRSSEVNAHVSRVSAIPLVREVMVSRQQFLAEQWGEVVMDGRDIGTCVLPDAQLKIYLDASTDERARRRWKECIEQGRNVSIGDIKKEIILRDSIDSGREVSPLEVAPGAVVLDTTDMTLPEVVNTIAGYVKR